MSLNRNQISLIHVAKAKLALDDESYRSILQQYAGVTSSRDMDDSGFKAVMTRFELLGFTHGTVKNFGVRPGMASPSQVQMIRNLWREYKGHEADDLSLGRWLERNWHVSSIRFLGYGEAQKAIGALKTMKARRFDKKANAAKS